MIAKLVRPVVGGGAVITALSVLMGTLGLWRTDATGPIGALLGLGAGLSFCVVIALHQAVRIAFVRSPEGRDVSALRTESAERQALRKAADGTLPDAVGVLILLSLLMPFVDEPATALLPPAGLVAVLIDVTVRTFIAWPRLHGAE